MNCCYINIEDLTLSGQLRDCLSILEEEWGGHFELVSCTEQYLIIRCNNEDFGEVKDICSFITSALLELEVNQFSILYQD